MTERHQETLKVVLARLVSSGAITVLDLGCGRGQRLPGRAGAFRARDIQLWQWVLSKRGVRGGYQRPEGY